MARSCARKTFASDQIQPASLDLRLGSRGLPRARLVPAGFGNIARRIDELIASHQFLTQRWRGAGDGLRLHRAAAGESGAAARDRRRRQSGRARPAASMSSPASSPTRCRGFDRIEAGYHGSALRRDLAAHLPGAGA